MFFLEARFFLGNGDKMLKDEIDECPLYEYVEFNEDEDMEYEYADFTNKEDEYRLCFKKRISCYDHDLALCLKKVLETNLAKNSTLKKGLHLLYNLVPE